MAELSTDKNAWLYVATPEQLRPRLEPLLARWQQALASLPLFGVPMRLKTILMWRAGRSVAGHVTPARSYSAFLAKIWQRTACMAWWRYKQTWLCCADVYASVLLKVNCKPGKRVQQTCNVSSSAIMD
ncbi:aspartyl-tRNA(Asn)/glutamyl-tRNA (Gln) amidotransferase subunit A [Erwinia amylovora Ea644]|nr:aspartyl-tRNA(Asn)/glutamyl-tRNA (Gln) amidotransferase subunit A [Erwinia amylovora Ea644]